MIDVKKLLDEYQKLHEEGNTVVIGSEDRLFNTFKIKTRNGYVLHKKGMQTEGLSLGSVNGRPLPGIVWRGE